MYHNILYLRMNLINILGMEVPDIILLVAKCNKKGNIKNLPKIKTERATRLWRQGMFIQEQNLHILIIEGAFIEKSFNIFA